MSSSQRAAARSLRRHASPVGLAASLSLALLGTVLLGIAGCTPAGAERTERLEQFAAADGAKASPLAELRAATAAIEQEGGLPTQLARAPLPADRNAAAALEEVLDGPLRTALDEPLERLTSRDRFDFGDDDWEAIELLFQRHSGRVERLQAAAGLPAAQFPIAPRLGYFANTAYLDDAAIACRFELVTAAVALLRDSTADAVTALERSARWIGWLAREPRLEPRLLAAQLRGEWLQAVAAVAAHPAGSLAVYERLRAVLVGWLAEWPDPADALRGDRAAGLHAYEAIRAGLIDEVATADEWERLKKHGVTAENPPTGDALDRDLLFYLQRMDRVVGLVRRPFYQRADKHATVAALLGEDEQAAAGAPLAAEMFLPGLPRALERLAVDRAACEAWAIALSAAGGFRLPEHRINPHNGEPYRVEPLPRSRVVRTLDAAIGDPFALVRTD